MAGSRWFRALRHWFGADASAPDLIVLATTPGEALVELWRSRLAAEHIPAVLQAPGGAGLYGGAYVLLVRRRDAAQAAAVLGLEPPDAE